MKKAVHSNDIARCAGLSRTAGHAVGGQNAAMSILYRLLPLLTMLSAVIAILALSRLGLPFDWGFIAKPLTTLLIIAYAWPRGTTVPRLGSRLRLGLVFSLAGDTFLLWPEQGFLPGLVSFLLAHLAYIAGFCNQARFARIAWPFALFAAAAAAVLSYLWAGVPAPLQVPVLAYVACLASMSAQSWVWWRVAATDEDQAGPARWAAIGGLLFLCSDALLATNKFAGPLPQATAWVLTSYWAAQWCIASSLAPAGISRAYIPLNKWV